MKNQQRMGGYNSKKNVPVNASRTPSTKIVIREMIKTRICTRQTHPGIWKNKWRQICFTLVFGDFGVKYQGKQHADHLISVLKEQNEIAKYWEGNIYFGLTFDWDYKGRKFHLSMIGHAERAM